jgi:hypothetical protein
MDTIAKTGSPEHSNELSGFIIGEEFLNELSDYQFFNKVSA